MVPPIRPDGDPAGVVEEGVGIDPRGGVVYDVDFIWTPTAIGDQVLPALSGNRSVQNGMFRAMVSMLKGRATAATGAWTVMRIDDRGSQRMQ